jgi:hypothetical protein
MRSLFNCAFFAFMCLFSLSESASSAIKESALKIQIKKDCSSDGQVKVIVNGPFVSLSGNYALAECIFGEGAGQGFYKRASSNKWTLLIAGGGALTPDYLTKELKIPKKDVDSIFRQMKAENSRDRQKKK